MRYEPEHYEFDFSFFEKYSITHKQVAKFSEDNYQQFLKQCKNSNGALEMSSEKNAEWIIRTYSATKMILAATLLLNSAEYAMQKNIMVSVPYLLYYAAFSACRAFLYVSAYGSANNLESLIEVNHSKLLEIVPDLIKSHFDKLLGSKIHEQLYYLRGQRELFSYKFPATGIRDKIQFDEVIDLCGLLAELAELASRQIQKVFEKKFLNTNEKFYLAQQTWMKPDNTILDRLYCYSIKKPNGKDSVQWVDQDDWYRVDYINRKVKYPVSILFTMTEGMVDDFFEAWCADENIQDDDTFDPETNWNLIFPIP